MISRTSFMPGLSRRAKRSTKRSTPRKIDRRAGSTTDLHCPRVTALGISFLVRDDSDAAMKAINSARQVFQFHLSLDGTVPPIWRRILVPADFTLAQLHLVIQAVMDWQDCHLHEINVAGREYGIPDPDGEHQFSDDRKVRLLDLNLTARSRISYTYDFGDEWLHVLKLEEVSQGDSDDIRALCIAGQRSGPPEDVGGVFGYEELLLARADPTNEQHQDAKEWLGDFDPEYFSIDEANQRLRRRLRHRKSAQRA
jgi:hypothetical protein